MKIRYSSNKSRSRRFPNQCAAYAERNIGLMVRYRDTRVVNPSRQRSGILVPIAEEKEETQIWVADVVCTMH